MANKKFWLAMPVMALAFGLVLAGCEHGPGGDGSAGDFKSFDAGDFQSLSDALREIGERPAPDGGEYVINITADITSGGWLITGDEYKDKSIFIKSDGTRTRVIQYASSVQFLFDVASGRLVLGSGITLRGISANTKALCRVILDGVLELEDGVIITGNTNTTAGVDPDGDAYKGGGAIEVRDGGSLYMYGGEITGNEANRGGGVGVFGRLKRAVFVMEGGRIYGNNSAGSVAASWGGGVHINFTNDIFTMNGGSIDNNKAARHGGGVSLCCGTFTINGTAVISDNEAGSGGGGVSMCCCTVIMNGGVIKRNKAGTSTSSAKTNALVLRYGGGIGRSGSINSSKQFPGVWDAPNIFRKTGGIIYGKDGGEDANTVVNPYTDPMNYTESATVSGDAVFMLRTYEDNTISGPYEFTDYEEYNPMNY